MLQILLALLHKNLYKKASIDGARKERGIEGEKQILENKDKRNTYLSPTEISAVCRRNVRLGEVGSHCFLFRITRALSTFPWLWCAPWSLCMLPIEKTCRSDMRNVMCETQLEPGLTLSLQERKKYGSHAEISSMPPLISPPAASAWQMTILSLSWVADMRRLNSGHDLFVWYRFSDIPKPPWGRITTTAFKLRWADMQSTSLASFCCGHMSVQFLWCSAELAYVHLKRRFWLEIREGFQATVLLKHLNTKMLVVLLN